MGAIVGRVSVLSCFQCKLLWCYAQTVFEIEKQ